MDSSDPYTHRRLLYKSDNSISKIYTNILRLLTSPQPDPQSLQSEAIKQIDSVIFQNFKYKNAILSLQKDVSMNQQMQQHADQQIQTSKQEIKQLTQDVKVAQLVRRRKLEFNSVAKVVKSYDTNEQFMRKLQAIESQVERLDREYRQEMEVYAEKERCLRLAISALRVLMREDGMAGSQSPVA